MIVLTRNQISAAEQSADELDRQRMRDHRCAMLYYEIRKLVDGIRSLFRDMNSDVEYWHGTAQPLTEEENEGLEEEYVELYGKLEGLFSKTHSLMVWSKSVGHPIEEERDFIQDWKELRSINCFSLGRIRSACAHARAGEFRSAGDVRNELRARLHA